MRSTYTLQRLLVLQRARKGEQNLPPLLTCRDMLEFATIAGARCANLDSKVGTLTPGKEADIVMLRADRLDVWPLNNAPWRVVNLMNPSHVDTVFIAGKVKKWRGNLVGVDVARVLRLVEEAARRRGAPRRLPDEPAGLTRNDRGSRIRVGCFAPSIEGRPLTHLLQALLEIIDMEVAPGRGFRLPRSKGRQPAVS